MSEQIDITKKKTFTAFHGREMVRLNRYCFEVKSTYTDGTGDLFYTMAVSPAFMEWFAIVWQPQLNLLTFGRSVAWYSDRETGSMSFYVQQDEVEDLIDKYCKGTGTTVGFPYDYSNPPGDRKDFVDVSI